jgi:hypothetical protein
LEDTIQMLKESYNQIKDAEVISSDDLGESPPFNRVHQSISLSLKLLWCTCAMITQQEQ